MQTLLYIVVINIKNKFNALESEKYVEKKSSIQPPTSYPVRLPADNPPCSLPSFISQETTPHPVLMGLTHSSLSFPSLEDLPRPLPLPSFSLSPALKSKPLTLIQFFVRKFFQ